MSLYNLLFGMNPNTDVVLALLGLRQHDVERFRNVSLDLEAGEISVYTRTGGGNREDYPQNALTSHPDYLRDKDDDFDSTYATFYLRIPQGMVDHAKCLANPSEHGIPAPLIRKVVEVMQRQSEADKLQARYEAHQRLCADLRRDGLAIHRNGWCLFPLGMPAVRRIFDVVERDGAWHGDNVIFGKLSVKRNHIDRYSGWSSVVVEPEDKWPFDTDFCERIKAELGPKFPKAMAVFLPQP